MANPIIANKNLQRLPTTAFYGTVSQPVVAPTTGVGMISPGNINVYDRPIVRNPKEGGLSTLFSGSYGDDKGEHLIPFVSDGADGRPPHIMGSREAIDYARKTGQNLGTFDTPEHATAFSNALHNQQATMGNFGGRTVQQAMIHPTAPPTAPNIPQISMPNSAPILSPAPSPIITKALDPMAQNTRNAILGHQAELQRLNDTGSGISQIKNPLLRGLARVGETAESIIAPRAAAFTPGTEMNHQRLIGQEQGRIDQGLGDQYQQARTNQENALTNYTEQRPDIARAGLQQKVQTAREKYTADLRKKGINVTGYDEETGLPTTEDDPDTMAYHQAAAETFIHEANAQKAKILSDIAKNKYLPGTPEYDREMENIHRLERQQQIALANIGLRGQSLALRRENMNAQLYGVGPDGQPVAGATQIVDDQGTPTTVGPRFANNAIKQQKTVGSFNDLSGSVNHLRDAIKAYEAEGGDMSDARLAAAASDPHSTIGKVIQGKMVTGGLSPAAINLLNAQRQTMEQAGILRSTTGGTSSEAGAQRILDVVPRFGSDTNASAYNKLEQQEEVLKRLAPGVTSVKGGMSVQHRQQQQSGTRRFTVNGTTYNIPADQVKEFLKDFPNAK